MKEDNFDNIRQKDKNLRNAIWQEEQELPLMPSDLNARLMQRVEEEEMATKKWQRCSRFLWPTVAAACVAALIAVLFTSPKDSHDDVTKQTATVASVEKQEKATECIKKVTPIVSPTLSDKKPIKKEKIRKNTETPKKPVIMREKAPNRQVLLAQETSNEKDDDMYISTEIENKQTSSAIVTLNENDIPITRPENLKHTPEEIALMRKQANEAYQKWVELELEISKYNIDQITQK